MEPTLMELELEKKKCVGTLEEIRKRLKKIHLWLFVMYGTIFIMLIMSVIDGFRGEFAWMILYALLGVLNLNNTSKCHKLRNDMRKEELNALFLLFILNKKKEYLKESC